MLCVPGTQSKHIKTTCVHCVLDLTGTGATQRRGKPFSVMEHVFGKCCSVSLHGYLFVGSMLFCRIVCRVNCISMLGDFVKVGSLFVRCTCHSFFFELPSFQKCSASLSQDWQRLRPPLWQSHGATAVPSMRP